MKHDKKLIKLAMSKAMNESLAHNVIPTAMRKYAEHMLSEQSGRIMLLESELKQLKDNEGLNCNLCGQDMVESELHD